MRYLVTGGAGFLGSHLCDKLIARGDDVICLDNLFTGQKKNIAHLLCHPSFEFIQGLLGASQLVAISALKSS
jgi:UDP-glucuronate decarboxylase